MAAIALESPHARDDMRDLIIEAVRLNGLRNAYVKWIVTRGVNLVEQRIEPGFAFRTFCVHGALPQFSLFRRLPLPQP